MRTNPRRAMTPLALAVLRLLLERPMHPYEIQQTVRERHVDQVVKMRAGSLYHTIERLHRYGLIEPVETGRAGRRPERTVYALTEAGRDEYASHLRDLLRMPQREYPVFGAAVEMMRTLGEADALRLLQQRTVALRAKLAALEQLVSGLTENGLARVDVLELDYALAITRAELDWVRQVIDDLTTGTLVWSDGPARDLPVEHGGTVRTDTDDPAAPDAAAGHHDTEEPRP
jgi:DNA-binding PadR family transcriptional regulator